MGCEQSTPVVSTTKPNYEANVTMSTAESIAERTTCSPLATDLMLGLPSCPVRVQVCILSFDGFPPLTHD